MKRIIVFGILLILFVFFGVFVFTHEETKWLKREIFQKETLLEELKISQTDTMGKNKIILITIYDNYRYSPKLKTGRGFSVLIKVGEQNILFDTGADSPTLFSNMEKLGISAEEIDFVFISHLHRDHTGGLSGIIEAKSDLKVYQPEFFFGPAQIANEVWTTGSLGVDVKEQSLIINSKQGLVIITGCAHPGVVNIIEKAKEIFPKKNVYLVIGGFHLSGASDQELKNIIIDFRKLRVQKVAPCHCSGDRCRELFKQEYGDNFIENGVGTIVNIE